MTLLSDRRGLLLAWLMTSLLWAAGVVFLGEADELFQDFSENRELIAESESALRNIEWGIQKGGLVKNSGAFADVTELQHAQEFLREELKFLRWDDERLGRRLGIAAAVIVVPPLLVFLLGYLLAWRRAGF